MTIERRDPLPAGRYWADIFPPNQSAWDTWSSAMADFDSVTIEHTEHLPAVDGAEAHDFVIWRTTMPNVAYRASGLPSPNIADVSIQTSDDTVQRPPPEPSVIDQLQSTASGIGSAAKVGVGVGIGLAVVVAAVAVFKR